MSEHVVLPSVREEVQERYQVGANYAETYLEYWQKTRGRTEESLEAILSRPQPEPLWFDFAMSTNQRAREFYASFEPHFGERRKRYLDVGCGFGGYLVVFAEQGFEVRGIEIDPERVSLSRANCADIGLEGVVQERSILEDGLEGSLGRFDVVTCMDVIEHVLDVPETLRNLRKLLNPGGTLILEIPNKDSIRFVREDGHFNLFGITQLTREESIAYHRRFFDFEYDVGYYHELDFYTDSLHALGLECTAFNTPGHVQNRRFVELAHAKALMRDWWRFSRSRARELPPEIRSSVHRKTARYTASMFWNTLLMYLRVREREPYRRRFLGNFWSVIARAPGER